MKAERRQVTVFFADVVGFIAFESTRGQPSTTSPSSLALFRRWARGRFIAAGKHFAALRIDHVDSGTRSAGHRCVSVMG